MKKIITLTLVVFITNLFAQNNLLKDDGDNTTALPSNTTNSIINEVSGNIGINVNTPTSLLDIKCNDGTGTNSVLNIENGRVGAIGTSYFPSIAPTLSPYSLKIKRIIPASYSIYGPASFTTITDLVVNDEGNIGIGIDNPVFKFDVNVSSRFSNNLTTSSNAYFNNNNYLNGNNEINGTTEYNNDVTFNNSGSLLMASYRNVNFLNQSTDFRCMRTTFGSSTIPSAYSYVAFNDVEVFFNANNKIYFDGFVPHLHIGYQKPTGDDADAIFSVDGKMMAKWCKITIHNWADDVFNKDYKLSNLNEVESFIKKNKHLPNIPNEKEVLANGIDLGEMNANLLRKIEEITLYLIELNKEVELLKQKVNDK